jgi:hypothetical protein
MSGWIIPNKLASQLLLGRIARSKMVLMGSFYQTSAPLGNNFKNPNPCCGDYE